MRRQRLKIIVCSILALLLIIQFFGPKRNTGEVYGPQSLAAAHPIPPATERILRKACYDCHSNNTRYPWYANVQPLGWWLQHHVDEGKESLNFSEWKTYSREDMPHILEELREEVEEGHMPLPSYLKMHSEANISAAEKNTLIQWARALEFELRGS